MSSEPKDPPLKDLAGVSIVRIGRQLMPQISSAPLSIARDIDARNHRRWVIHVAGSTAVVLAGAVYGIVKILTRTPPAQAVRGSAAGPASDVVGSLPWISISVVPIELVALVGAVVLVVAYLKNRGHRSELLQVAERAQKDLQTRFVDLFRFANEAVFLIDADGLIIEANQQAEKIYGYTHAELLALNVTELRAVDVRANVAPEMDYVKAHGNLRRETIHVRRDGTHFPVEFSATAIDMDGTVMYQDIVRDIGEEKRADERVRETSEQMTRLVRQLEERNRQNVILSEMREFLLACSALGEIGPVVARSMNQLLPDVQGALFLLSPSRTDLETTARWGGYPDTLEDNLFAPDSCWGLRRGIGHIVEEISGGLVCPHLKHAGTGGYACLPLMARGEVLGLLHVRQAGASGEIEPSGSISTIKELASTVVEVLSLSIWNIRLRETLGNQAIKDPLTGLFNRTFMDEALQREIYRAGRMHSQVGVVMVDVDRFKRFNDEHGHAAGDLVLAELANFLKWHVRKGDVVCRYGGEEFVLILPDSPEADTIERATQLKESIKGLRVSYGGQEIGPVRVSMGVAMYPGSGAKSADLLRAADVALYQAKQEGRDRVVFINRTLPEQTTPANGTSRAAA